MSRQRRTQLEQLQRDLKKAKATLPPAIAALETSIEETIRLADTAASLVERLKAQRKESSQRLIQLRDEQQEQDVLERGKSRRNYYVDWTQRDWGLAVAGAMLVLLLMLVAGFGG